MQNPYTPSTGLSLGGGVNAAAVNYASSTYVSPGVLQQGVVPGGIPASYTSAAGAAALPVAAYPGAVFAAPAVQLPAHALQAQYAQNVASGAAVHVPFPPTLMPHSAAFPNSIAAAAYSAAAVAGLIDTTVDPDDVEIQKCHLHTKPQLSCKYCRKYKSAVHHQARLAMVQEMQRPVEEKKNMVEMTNTTTYNINNLLRENILSSEYFKSLYSLKTYNEVVDEIYQYADHAEPYCGGSSRAPSTLFCCLYKLLTMRLNQKQMKGLLDHVDSPYIRCAGFLYLRYAHPPEKLWDWFEPYFLDDEEFTPGVDKHHVETIGKYVEALITEDKYFSTVLPRLPVKIKNQYGAQLLALDEHRVRKQTNKSRLDLFVPGAKVQACSNGDWLEGEVVRVEDLGGERISVLVKLEDENEEYINLGLVKLIEEKEKKDDKKKKEKKYKPSSADENVKNEDMSNTTSNNHNIDDRYEPSRSSCSIANVLNGSDGDSSEITRSRSRGDSEDGKRRHRRHSGKHSKKEKKIKKHKKHKKNEEGDGRPSRRSESLSSESSSHRKKRKHRRKHSRSGSSSDASSRSRSKGGHRDSSADDRKKKKERREGRERDRRSRERKDREKEKEKDDTTEADEDTNNVKSQDQLMIEFRRRERQKALATGKDYARRPTSYKSSLSLRMNTSRKRSRSRSPSRVNAGTANDSYSTCSNSVMRERERGERERGRERERERGERERDRERDREREKSRDEAAKKKEPSLEHKQKMAQLMERYTKNVSGGSSRSRDVEGPDVVRLG